MLKNIVVIIAFVFGMLAWAEPVKMPSKSEINVAKDAVEGLMSSGTTADEFLEMAEESEGGAEKYHAYRCAFILQVKEGKYAEAAETLKTFQAEVTGVPASEIVSLVDKNVGKKLKEAKDLQAVYNDAKAKVTAEKQIAKIKKEIKKNPKDPILKRSLAEAMAISGDWTAALKEFEKAGGEVADIVKAEKKGPTARIAAFWWDYKPHKNFGATNAFKLHAANLYAILLDKGGLNKLESSLAEKRVAAAEELGTVVEESAGGDGKPKSELAALKKICNTKGLAHCWRFNGNAKDCVEGKDANLVGNVIQGDKQIMLQGGAYGSSHIDLGLGLFTGNEGWTIEIWATEKSVQEWARVFNLGTVGGDDILMTWSMGRSHNGSVYCRLKGCEYAQTDTCLIPIDSELHIVMVMDSVGTKGQNLHVYIQDAITGNMMCKLNLTHSVSSDKLADKQFFLGHAAGTPSNADANAAYNEVRIWNRALSEEELTQNAIKFHKAGETMKK